MMKFPRVLAGVALLFLFSEARAGLAVSEGFNYTVGAPLDGQNGGFGFSGPWNEQPSSTTVVGNGLTYPGLPSSGAGAALVSSAQTATDQRTFSQDRSGLTTWVSFLYNRSGTGNGQSGLVFGSGATTLAGGFITGTGVFFGQEGASGQMVMTADPNFNFGISTGVAPAFNTTYLVVAQFDYTSANGGTLNMFVNPPIGASPGSPQASTSFTMTNLNLVGFDVAQSTSFDEIRVADTYEEVIGVPEPSTYVLLALGLTALVLWKNRATRGSACPTDS